MELGADKLGAFLGIMVGYEGSLRLLGLLRHQNSSSNPDFLTKNLHLYGMKEGIPRVVFLQFLRIVPDP